MKTPTMVSAVLVGLLGLAGSAVQAAVLQPGDLLTIGSGSWFGLDMDIDGQIVFGETVQVYPGLSGAIVIGGDGVVMPQAIGLIDTWTLFGAPGNHYTTVAPTGSTEAGLDFSGWSIYYNGSTVAAAVDYGAWTPANCGVLGCAGVTFTADVAAISWSGVYGDSYSLWYSWHFQDAAPGAMLPTYYLLHLEGVVTADASPVPLPPALWLLGAGLSVLAARGHRRHGP